MNRAGAADTTDDATLRGTAAPLLNEDAPLLPPVTRRKILRVGLVYAAVWTTAVVLVLTERPALVGVGAGLFLPGGSHLASGHVLHGVVVLIAFAVSVLVWWMIGAYVAPFIVWGVDLALVALLPHSHVHLSVTAVFAVAAVVPAAVAVSLGWHIVRHTRRRRAAAITNAQLRDVRFEVTRGPSRVELPVSEASPEDLARLRLALDLALQPTDRFDGFDRRDQFREAALRYQLCILGYALATYRYNCAPAFAGYLTEAQSRSIQKMGDRRVWGYWGLENAWGRLRLGRDPVDNTDNIMLTGWQGVAVGMFETLEDARFSEPGSLTYTWSAEEAYPNDFASLASSIERNMHRSPYTLYSCEPRWIYPVCNTFGVNTLVLHDRLHGTSMFAGLEERIRQSYLEEFHRPDGRIVGVRSETLGLSWSPWSGDGVWLPTTYWMHPALPDLAHRSWWLMRQSVLRHDGERFHLPATIANRCDAGSYSFARDTFGQILLAMAAREIGDEEVASNVLAHLDETEGILRSGGVARYADVSVQGNLYSLMARFGRSAGLRDLVNHGMPEAWSTGPRLADASYPDVLVARAVTDGAGLECVLYPGEEPVRAPLTIDRARPGRHYRLRGAVETDVVADSTGRAVVHVDLGGRTEISFEPAV